MAHHHRENRDNRGRRSTQLSDLDPALTDLSRRTIGCAIEVHKELGPGYPLEIYLNALKIEFRDSSSFHKFRIFATQSSTQMEAA